MATVNELRTNLRQLRSRVQFQGERIEVSCYGELVGVLMPIEQANGLQPQRIKTVALREFRRELTQYWESLQSEVDCLFLTAHDHDVMAFVSPRLVVGGQLCRA